MVLFFCYNDLIASTGGFLLAINTGMNVAMKEITKATPKINAMFIIPKLSNGIPSIESINILLR